MHCRQVFCAICGGCLEDELPFAFESFVTEFPHKDPTHATLDHIPDVDKDFYLGYDPCVLTAEDAAWLRDIRLLGYNPDGKAFLSGGVFSNGVSRSGFTTRGLFKEYEPAEDPNKPAHITHFMAYASPPEGHPPSFPIHEACIELFTRFSAQKYNLPALDKDSLYHAMLRLSNPHAGVLNLDYGEPVHGDRGGTWMGEEMLGAWPLPSPLFTLPLRSTVSTESFHLPAPLSPNITASHTTTNSSTSTPGHDPFALLPHDLHHDLALLLPASSLLALTTASPAVHASLAANQGFWKRAIGACMPWFWELHTLIRHETVDPETTDWRGLFLWAERKTRVRRGVWMGVANRRRVWGVCERIGEEGGYGRR